MMPYVSENVKTLLVPHLYVIILFQATFFFQIFPVAVLKKVTFWHFEFPIQIKGLKFSLTQEPGGNSMRSSFYSYDFLALLDFVSRATVMAQASVIRRPSVRP